MPNKSPHDSVYRSRLLTALTRPTTLVPNRITSETVGYQALVVASVLEGMDHAFSETLCLFISHLSHASLSHLYNKLLHRRETLFH
jgi:hypothetical protein